jgi:hypothetical protein
MSKAKKSANAEPVHQNPTRGGVYVRHEDGSLELEHEHLKRMQPAEEAEEVAEEETTEEETESQTTPRRKRGRR